MKRLIVLALPEGYLMGVAIPADVFRVANRIHHYQNPEDPLPIFDIKIAALTPEPVVCLGGTQIVPDMGIEKATSADLVMVPGINRYDDAFFEAVAPAIKWLRKTHRGQVPIASFCTGAFVLAEAHLLDGRMATTHWAFERLFMSRYPKVNMQAHQLLVDEGDLLCAGGAHAGIDLCLYLLARYSGKALARNTAKVLVHDLERVSQLPYAKFRFERKNGDQKIQRAQEHIEKRFEERLDVMALAKEVGLGRRTLERKFRQATGMTPLSYLQQVRLEAAKRMLEEGTLGFEEITARVGYEDTSSFRKLFIKRAGLTPAAYKKKFTIRWPVEY